MNRQPILDLLVTSIVDTIEIPADHTLPMSIHVATIIVTYLAEKSYMYIRSYM